MSFEFKAGYTDVKACDIFERCGDKLLFCKGQ